MKVSFTCSECLFPTKGIRPTTVRGYDAVITEDGVHHLHCENGHHNVIFVNEIKYHTLFQIGVNAIFDGYYREAVSSITSSLERFFEFYIRVVVETHSIEMEIFQKAWKAIGKQSERQLGAYVMAHMLQSGMMPNLLDEKSVGFRNKVIHQGLIPSKDESIKYANTVLRLITTTLRETKVTLMDATKTVWTRELHQRYSGLEADCSQQTTSVAPALPMLVPVNPWNELSESTIVDALEEIEKSRKHHPTGVHRSVVYNPEGTTASRGPYKDE